MTTAAQKKAQRSYRTRLGQRGVTRFEVLARGSDRDLIRSLARQLAAEGPDADRIRAAVRSVLSGDGNMRGGILAALQDSPLAGIDLDLVRSVEDGRQVEL